MVMSFPDQIQLNTAGFYDEKQKELLRGATQKNPFSAHRRSCAGE
jgi:hypothetical protein